MTGIYKFTNVITGLSYIGQSKNIKNRLQAHKQTAFNASPSNKSYYNNFYKAIREYGLDNFEFDILEECSEEQLNEREIYWIAFYDSYNNGYNMTPGGDGIKSNEGEDHPRHKLTEKQVYEIRERYANHEYCYRVYEDYKTLIGESGFKKIWNGYTWTKVHMDVYTDENKKFHKWVRNCHPGRKTGTGPQLTEDDIRTIRKRILTENPDEVYLDYQAKFKYRQNFTNICNYKTYKNITL